MRLMSYAPYSPPSGRFISNPSSSGKGRSTTPLVQFSGSTPSVWGWLASVILPPIWACQLESNKQAINSLCEQELFTESPGKCSLNGGEVLDLLSEGRSLYLYQIEEKDVKIKAETWGPDRRNIFLTVNPGYDAHPKSETAAKVEDFLKQAMALKLLYYVKKHNNADVYALTPYGQYVVKQVEQAKK